ncbi:MAG: hypothetical protein A2Y23_11755 [Clostridiales bacterium GWB2_37_7]|nr:MAG: hypothetical protein A2Y23_11755 [Clostridiales bacterium GWB2_37_7]
MKKGLMSKLMILVLVGAIASTTLMVPVNADAAAEKKSIKDTQVQTITDYIPAIEKDPYTVVSEDGTVIYFKNQEDYGMYMRSQNQRSISSSSDGSEIRPLSGYTLVPTVLSSENKSMLWIGYHSATPYWAKASGYTLTSDTSYSASGSYEYQGFTVNLEFTYTTGAQVSFTADSARWSKLGTWGDFTFQYVRFDEYYYGTPTGNVSYTVTKAMHNKYVAVKYQ